MRGEVQSEGEDNVACEGQDTRGSERAGKM